MRAPAPANESECHLRIRHFRHPRGHHRVHFARPPATQLPFHPGTRCKDEDQQGTPRPFASRPRSTPNGESSAVAARPPRPLPARNRVGGHAGQARVPDGPRLPQTRLPPILCEDVLPAYPQTIEQTGIDRTYPCLEAPPADGHAASRPSRSLGHRSGCRMAGCEWKGGVCFAPACPYPAPSARTGGSRYGAAPHSESVSFSWGFRF
jgi:hypothetical protein